MRDETYFYLRLISDVVAADAEKGLLDLRERLTKLPEVQSVHDVFFHGRGGYGVQLVLTKQTSIGDLLSILETQGYRAVL